MLRKKLMQLFFLKMMTLDSSKLIRRIKKLVKCRKQTKTIFISFEPWIGLIQISILLSACQSKSIDTWIPCLQNLQVLTKHAHLWTDEQIKVCYPQITNKLVNFRLCSSCNLTSKTAAILCTRLSSTSSSVSQDMHGLFNSPTLLVKYIWTTWNIKHDLI